MDLRPPHAPHRGDIPTPMTARRPPVSLGRRDAHDTVIESAGMSMPRAVLVAMAVGGAFGLGLISGAVGHSDDDVPSREARTSGAEVDPIAAVEARTKAYEQKIASATTTWHRELTGDDPGMPPLPQLEKMPRPKPAEPRPEEDVAAMEQADSDTVDAVRAEGKARSAQEQKDRAADKAAADNDRGDDDDAPDAPVKTAKDSARDGDRGDVSATSSSKKVDDALKRVLGEKSDKSEKPGAGARQTYALQLASTATAEGAQALAETFKQKGVRAAIVAAEIPGKGTMYRLRVTGLDSREAAQALKEKVGQGLVVAEE